MNIPRINPRPYVQMPRIGVQSGLSLARMLLAANPEEATEGMSIAAEILGDRVEQLDTQWQRKVGTRRAEDVRPYDHRLDRAWSTVKLSLDRYVILDPEEPDHERASEILEQLFPTGLDFIARPFIEQHAESQRRVVLLEDEQLREDVDRLVGETFVQELLAAHEAYGVALHITEESDEPSPISLVAPLRALREAIGAYVLQVLAFAGLDPENNTEVARRALQPIDALRRAVARRKRRGGSSFDDQALADALTTSDDPSDDAMDDSDVAVSAA